MIEAALERARRASPRRRRRAARSGIVGVLRAGPADAVPAARCREFDRGRRRPTMTIGARGAGAQGEAAFQRKLDVPRREFATSIGRADVERRCSRYVMLNVLDEKWKDHLYDLDQLRNAIQYRVLGPEGSARRVQEGGVHDVRGPDARHHHTFTERFLRGAGRVRRPRGPAPPPPRAAAPARPKRHYNALGVVEDVGDGRRARATCSTSARRRRRGRVAVRREPIDRRRGAGRRASLAAARRRGRDGATGRTSGRNDPCPCGSGKKFKKCHGANA